MPKETITITDGKVVVTETKDVITYQGSIDELDEKIAFLERVQVNLENDVNRNQAKIDELNALKAKILAVV